MQLRNKKQLPEMTRPPPNPNATASNAASMSGTATNPQYHQVLHNQPKIAPWDLW